jgi:hypothetical protein
MNIKVFSFTKPYFSVWKIPADKVESEINSWLLINPRAKVSEIKHDLTQGIWYPPQLIVTVYYTHSDEKSS